jgi:tetratricopeptide (TPR) repeat protein
MEVRVMGITDRACGLALFSIATLGMAQAQVLGSGQTVRHHQVAESDGDPELTQAEEAIEKNNYSAAEPLLKKIVGDHPENYQAWFDLGFVYNAEGNTAESIAAYRRSVAAKPDVFESNLNLGLLLAKNGQSDAENFLRRATTLKPAANADEGHARAWLSLAHVIEDRKPVEALQAYKQAAALQPNDPEPHLSAGVLLEKENRFADAESEYKQALAIDPKSADAMIGLSNIYMRGQRLADAEEFLRKLVALEPENAGAHIQLGRVLAASGHNDEALTELQTALKLEPQNVTLQRDLADLYTSAGKYQDAEKSYRALLAAHPETPELHYGLGVALLKQKKYPVAEQEFIAAVKLKQDYGEAYGDLAVAATENNDYALAIQAADDRAKYLPEIPVAYFLRASAYDHLRDYKQAAQNYHKFLEVANGKYPDQEWQARHRLIAIEPKK